MADLNALVANSLGRSLILPPVSALSRVIGSEGLHATETLTVRLGLLLGTPTAEGLKLSSNFVTIIRGNTGQVAFNANLEHASVTNYTARVRVSGNSTVVATQSLGVPTPDGNNVIVVDLSATFSGLAAENYTVSILTTTAGGSTDSAESNAFALPLT